MPNNKLLKTKSEILKTHAKALKSKKLISFDLDGTLTASKSDMDLEMAELICKLLEIKKVAVIGGGAYKQFKNQFIKQLNDYLESHKILLKSKKTSKQKILKNLYLFPTTGLVFYKYKNNKWNKIYEISLSKKSQTEIKHAFNKGFDMIAFDIPKKIYGKLIENRKTQITFSALGQKAPLKAKSDWHKNHDIRKNLISALKKIIPNFEIHMGGLTSVDITRKNTDKGFAIKQIEKYLKLKPSDIAFIGDAVFKGGNDYEALKAKVVTIKVKDHNETKELIRTIL